MDSELLSVFEYFEKEKGIERSTMVEALENALLTASRKSVGPARGLHVEMNPDNGDIKVLASLVCVEEVSLPYDQISVAQAQKIKPGAVIDDEVVVEVTPKNFGRIAAQTAKQAMMQRLRQAEKEMIYDEFKDRSGEVVSGTVARFERSDVIINLGRFEGVMPSRERVQTEDYSIGDRIRAYVVAVENETRGPEIVLSRSHPNFVRRLFESEVSEIADQTVEIRGIARESGYRTKIAVHSADSKIDPVGACVGLRGARVKNIVRELNNEKVDIIRWSDDTKEFVMDALKPAEIRNIEILEDEKMVKVTVEEEELSKAIGRRGQNARLTSRLVGWDVQVEKDESAKEKFDAKVQEAIDALAADAGLESAQAEALVLAGINSVDILAGVDAEDIAGIIEVEESAAATIIAQAKASQGTGGESSESTESSTTAETSSEKAEESATAEAAPEPENQESSKEEVAEATSDAPEKTPEAETTEEDSPKEEELAEATQAEEKAEEAQSPEAAEQTSEEEATA